MTELALAAIAFIVTHFVSSTPLRPALIRRLGERAFRGLYSLVAGATLLWMIRAFAHAPLETLWPGLRPLPSLLMPLAFVLLACGYRLNPTMVGAEKLLRNDDPARGMIRVTRHPIMWAILLWSGAHVLARGDLASLLFFGTFFAVAALGTATIDRRKSSNPDWARFAAVTSNVPLLAIAQGRNRVVWQEIGWMRPMIGLVVFVAFLHLHPWLFGVRPY
jgi:uncharacterized membrane protein